MIQRLFAPVLSYRLFDPMPLPRRVRALQLNRGTVAQVGKTFSIVRFSRKIKKIPCR